MIRILLMLMCTLSIVGLQAQTKSIDASNSTINWVGKKVTGQHSGEISIKEGTLEFTDGVLSGGSFIIDMTSIKTTDLSGNMAGKLDGHLKSDDFFGVASFPTATLLITDVTPKDGSYTVTADLTIKETTAPVTFVTNVTPNEATADITVDRTV